MALPALLFAAALGSGAGGPPPVQEPVWEEVRPLLERRCLPCHGGERVKSRFRLATATTFRRGGARGPAVDPGDPARSRLLEVIGYGNPDLAMPPDGRLPEAEIEVLRRWVLAGAPWPEGPEGRLADPERFPDEPEGAGREALNWWAWTTSPKPELPRGAASGAAHPVDAFLLADLNEAGLRPAPRAAPRVLLRRATLALTGLPPTPEETSAFLEAVERRGFEAAWEELLDRLLASPHYGEQMARRWMDLVRYAETNGYERDARKTNIWRYRDWLIRSFEEDKPWDRFVLEQLAGDELATYAPELVPPEDPTGPLLATGYYLLGLWQDEPVDVAQSQADELADVVDTTAQAFLGLTLGCARCHDHKADPISQRDYYAFTAWFNNLLGYGGGAVGQHLGGGFTTPVADRPRPGQESVAERDRRIAAVDLELRPFLEELRRKVPERTGEERILVADAAAGPALWRYHLGEAPAAWPAPGFDDASWAEGPSGFGREGTPGSRIGTPWTGDRIQLRTRFRLTSIPEGLVLRFHHDDDLQVFLNGVLVFERSGYVTEYQEVQLPSEAVDALVVGSNVLAVSCVQDFGGQYVDVGLRSGWLSDASQEEAWRIRLASQGERFLSPERWAEARRLLAERRSLEELPVAEPYPALIAVERGPEAPVQHVLLRGSVHARGEVVEPGVPRVFLQDGRRGPVPPEPPPGARSSGRRLALARWLVGEGRFFSARVQANRLWQYAFGRGLCPTPGDFGHLGQPPTHPELLDYLAWELLERDGSLKEMLRFLMTSEAWMRASTAGAETLEADPLNRLYARFPPRRLTAEEYRDSLLRTSGLLNPARFGPSVFPPLPEEILTTASRPDQAWGVSPPEEANRRSLYIHVKRSLRFPLLAALDQPEPDLACPERFPTNVPTQALMTLNGSFPWEAAEALARRVEAEAGDRAGRVERAVERVLGRPCAPQETARHLALLDRLEQEEGLSPHGALQLFCLGLYNLNEFFWID